MVAMIEEESYHLGMVLKELIEKKSKRDCSNFSIYQLANHLKMPRSILVRLMHPDPAKRVKNPRIETLIKIVDFFQQDGFNITINDLLNFNGKRKTEVVTEKLPCAFNVSATLALYSFNSPSKQCGQVDVKLPTSAEGLIAFISEENVEPIFKKGSIFIVNTKLKPENANLVAIKIKNNPAILIRKFFVKKHQQIIQTCDLREKIILMPTMHHQIIGVVIQVNAVT